MANNPRHGDAIIKMVPDGLGGNKFIASRQFQQFLDDLGADQITASTDGDDDLQLINAGQDAINSKISSLQSSITYLDDKAQESQSNSAMIADNRDLRLLVNDSVELINITNSQLMHYQAISSKMNKRLDELEQLLNVD